jgi:hypothetical protein
MLSKELEFPATIDVAIINNKDNVTRIFFILNSSPENHFVFLNL